jgi:hypothetical protein
MEYAYPTAVESSNNVTYVNVLNGLLCCPSLKEPQVAPPLITDPTELTAIYAFSNNLTNNLLPAFTMTSITSSSDIEPISSGQWYRLDTTDPVTLTFQPTHESDLFYIYNEGAIDFTDVTFVLNEATIDNIYIISDADITASLTPMYGNFICAGFHVRHALNVMYGTITCGCVYDDTSPQHAPHTVVGDILTIYRSLSKQSNQTSILAAKTVYLSTLHIPPYTAPPVLDPYIPETTDIPVYEDFYVDEDSDLTSGIVLNKDGTGELFVIVVT